MDILCVCVCAWLGSRSFAKQPNDQRSRILFDIADRTSTKSNHACYEWTYSCNSFQKNAITSESRGRHKWHLEGHSLLHRCFATFVVQSLCQSEWWNAFASKSKPVDGVAQLGPNNMHVYVTCEHLLQRSGGSMNHPQPSSSPLQNLWRGVEFGGMCAKEQMQ